MSEPAPHTQTASGWIDDKGGPAAVALKVRRKPGAVRLWKHRDRLPRDAWPDILEAYPDTTLNRLREIERGSPAEPTKSPAPTVADAPSTSEVAA